MKNLIKTQFSENHVWEVKGYLPSLNEKKVYNHFGKFLMNAKLTKSIEKVSISDLLVEYR